MSLYFLDTSALVKRYISEMGSRWVRELCGTETIVISALALAEVNSVFARRTREGTIALAGRDALLHVFQSHVVQYSLVDVDRTVLNAAGAMLINAPAATSLRSLDAIQLASAQSFAATFATSGLGPMTFVTADTRLLAAAQWAGFADDNPERHP